MLPYSNYPVCLMLLLFFIEGRIMRSNFDRTPNRPPLSCWRCCCCCVIFSVLAVVGVVVAMISAVSAVSAVTAVTADV